MKKINSEMRQVIEDQKLCYVATSSLSGETNVSPKGSIMCLDEETLIFAAVRSEKTLKNIAENSSIAVAVLDLKQRKGYQFKGNAEKVTEGEKYNYVVEPLRKRLPNLGHVQAAVVIKVKEIIAF